MVGGVNSPVRAFNAVGGSPLFISRGKGSEVWDADGNRFLDYVCSWGALILGHANNVVSEKVTASLLKGTSFGAPTEAELLLAEKICDAVPSIEKVRFVNSGTEATMSALRLARAYTRRKKVIKFEGGYHGHADPFLVRGGSGLATLGIPSSPGVPSETVSNTLNLPYNDSEAVLKALREAGDEVAAVIVEPVAGNMGVIPPRAGFLESLREGCDRSESLLIFDEVITGFRVALSGAQGLFRTTPDLTCLGKIIGGGFPVGAYGGSREIMRLIAPEGPVYQAGTLSGNPVAMTAGLATISLLSDQTYRTLEARARLLEAGLLKAAAQNRVAVRINRVGSMLGIFFTSSEVTDFADAKRTDNRTYTNFFWRMLDGGVYLPPSPFESLFLSTAHKEDHVRETIQAAQSAFGSAWFNKR